jgi:multiple sugar transport system permease protein
VLDPSPSGLFNHLLTAAGVPREVLPDWLGNSAWGLTTIIVISIWRQLGFCIVLYLAALTSVPRSLYDAAAVDGAGGWQTLWNVTWPGVRPMTVFLMITGTITALQVFDIVLLMIGKAQQSGTDVLNLYLYREFTANRLGFAATIGVVVLLLTVAITLAQVWTMRGSTGGAR